MPIYEVEITPEQKAGLMVDKPSHPPIPPNCPNFVFRGEPRQWSFEAFFPHQGIRRWLNYDMDIGERSIIAAVARCAWLDEVTRLLSDTKWLSEPVDCRTDPARENAEAWRIWGLQK